jgi:inorganic pyrophosphatase
MHRVPRGHAPRGRADTWRQSARSSNATIGISNAADRLRKRAASRPAGGRKTMSLSKVGAGRSVPEEFNVVIEIPMNADPVKYEVDKESGALFVDRFIGTAMHYPCNYGYIPRTLGEDGDPIDVLVITPFPLQQGVVVRSRPLGLLAMEDDGGGDAKLLAVPIDKVLPWYRHWKSPSDLAPERLAQIQHFFEHYKDLEAGKWVKIVGWKGAEAAREEIMAAVARYEVAAVKPAF